jgi:hypothetical protein
MQYRITDDGRGPGRQAGPVLTVRFSDTEFQRRFELALSDTHRGAGDAGEVLDTAARVRDGDPDSWVDEWAASGGAAWAAAGVAEGAHHRVSARAHLQRAAAYYATALALVHRSSEPERELDLWRRQRDCWERTVDLLGGERLAIDCDGAALPGYLFSAPAAAPDEARPVVVVHRGFGDLASRAWVLGGAAAAERGYHWMTFDGPGHTGAPPARHDAEAVLTPLVDALVARPDVDATRLAVIGTDEAGLAVARALAFEHRFAAAAVDPGVVDLSAAWSAELPAPLREELEAGKSVAFDRELRIAELLSPALAARLRARARPFGLRETSRFGLFRAAAAFRLDGEARRIRTPLLVTEREREACWPGQAPELVGRLQGPRRLVRLRAEGGGPASSALRETSLFDWLDAYLT